MLRVEITRPDSVGTIITKDFDSYAEAELFIESKAEKLADYGWQLTEVKGSSSKAGTIDGTHEETNGILKIRWYRIETPSMTPEEAEKACAEYWQAIRESRKE